MTELARKRLRSAFLALPLTTLLLMFFLIPLVNTLWSSFFGSLFNFKNYTAIVVEPVNFKILSHTLTVGLTVTVTSLVIAYPVAYQLTRVSPKSFSGISTLILIPLFTAFLIRTYSWIIILGRQGIVNSVLIKSGLTSEPLVILNTTLAVVIGMTHVFVPMAIFTIYSGMAQIDRSFVRAASSLGAHPVQVFTRVYFPMTLASVMAAGVIIFVVAIGFYITPSLLGGPADTMISQLVVMQMTTLLDFEMGYALSVVLLIITLGSILLAGLIVPIESIWSSDVAALKTPVEKRAPVAGLQAAVRNIIRPLRFLIEECIYAGFRVFSPLPVPWLTLYCGLVLFFLVAPLLVVVVLSFSSSPFVIFPPPGLSIRWWEKLYAATDWHSAFLFSIKVGVVTAGCSTLIGSMGAFWLVRTELPAKRVLYLLAMGPLIVPGIVMATSLYVFEARLGLLGTFPGLVVGHVLLATPYVVIVMSSSLRNFDRRLEQAAAIHGANGYQTLRYVTLPLLAPGLITSALLAFLTSFDELLLTIFLLGRQSSTLPIKFWGDIKYQLDPMLSTASTLIVVVVVMAVLSVQWYNVHKERQKTAGNS